MPPFIAIRLSALLALGLGLAAGPAAAQSFYAGMGNTGLTLGYAHVYSDRLGARAELAVLPSLSRGFEEDGIAYDGSLRSTRGAALFDWRPAGSGFRLTAGLSLNDTRAEFAGSPIVPGTITIGGSTVSFGPADRYTARVELPAAMPYLGLGWGHAAGAGWGFHADLGVLVGEGRVSGALSPSLRAKIALTGADPDVELERELQTVRDEVGRVNLIPVLSLGVSYRW